MRIIFDNPKKRAFFYTIDSVVVGACLLLLFLFPKIVGAQISEPIELARLFLDAHTITKGYTVENAEAGIKIGVVDRAVTVPVEVVIKNIPASHHLASSKTVERIGNIIEYDIRKSVAEGTKTESIGVLEKPIYISLKFDSETVNKKVIHFWNKPNNEWVPLPSTTDFKNNSVRAVSHFPYARLAIFDDPLVYEGPASWYVSGFHCECAASPIYQRKTMLKVTNIEPGSPKRGTSMVVRVNDYGPDPNIHPDRPIDLDKVAFAQLAQSVGAGIMMVRVEPVDPETAKKYSWVIEAEAERLAARVNPEVINSGVVEAVGAVEEESFDSTETISSGEISKLDIKFKTELEI